MAEKTATTEQNALEIAALRVRVEALETALKTTRPARSTDELEREHGSRGVRGMGPH